MFGIQPPDRAVGKISEPDGSMPESNTIAAGSAPLLNYGIRWWLDPGHGNFKNGGPHRTLSESNFSAGARDTHRNRCHQLVGLGIDAGDCAVALIERPNRTCSHGEKT